MSNSAPPNPFADDHHMKPWETVRRGLLMLVSSPGGAGKTSLSRRLVADYADMILSISATTRAPRPGEEEGREYFFKTRAQFEAMVEAGELLEWAEVNGNCYGTPKAPVMTAMEAGKDVLFDIDWQGAQQVADRAASDSVRVFVLPPSWSDLARRLFARAQDSHEIIQQRLDLGKREIAHWGEYDYVIVNANLETSSAGLAAILAAERLKRARRTGLDAFVRGVLDGL